MADLDDIIDDLGAEPIVQINLDEIDSAAADDARSITDRVIRLLADEEWMKSHPQIGARLEVELEQIRRHNKMLRSDEQVHDALLMAISSNSSNASLYRNLAVIQKTMLDIQTQMNEAIKRVNDMMKGFQLEIPFENKTDDTSVKENEDGSMLSRGTKDFIKQMKNDE